MPTRYAFRLSDNQFLRGGWYDPEFNPATEGVAEYGETHPDRRTERHDAASPTKKRPATAAEIAAYDAAQVDLEALSSVETKAIKAALLTAVFFINEVRTQPTTVFPTLTAAEVRSRFLTIWRTL